MIVTIAQGAVEGAEHDGVATFRGLPYASALDADRFRPPRPADGWDGLRVADAFGPSSWQAGGGILSVLGGEDLHLDEDCLSLNVQAPTSEGTSRPVLVWIHGGGYTSGSSATRWYDGTRLVQRGDVVVVSVNYRLGALGFLWLGDLDGGDAYRTSGINGVLDQVEALRWVRDNIAAFGGDPGNVIVVGESAGAMSIATLLALPSAHGLFHKAILQSGAAHNCFDPEVASEVTSTVMAHLGVTDLAGVLAAEPQALVAAGSRVQQAAFRDPGRLTGATGISLAMPFQPVVDGEHLPIHPIDAVASGASAGLPLLVGTTLDEWNLFRLLTPGGLDHPELLDRLDAIAGHGHELHDAYAAERPSASPDELWSAVLTDVVFRVPAVRLLEAHARAEHPTAPRAPGYEYLFTWPTPVFGGLMGASHALEVPFVFDTIGLPGAELFLGAPAGPELHTLAASVQAAWLAFARTGDPSHEGLPPWPAFDPDDRRVMALDLEPRVLHDPQRRQLACWDGLR
jgi:para-nitrobenzyl esterase